MSLEVDRRARLAAALAPAGSFAMRASMGKSRELLKEGRAKAVSLRPKRNGAMAHPRRKARLS
jgi:hypothetical protein